MDEKDDKLDLILRKLDELDRRVGNVEDKMQKEIKQESHIQSEVEKEEKKIENEEKELRAPFLFRNNKVLRLNNALLIFVSIVVIAILILLALHFYYPKEAVSTTAHVVFTSPNLAGVTSSNLGNIPLGNPIENLNFSKINNSGTSLQFFKGPVGTPEPDYVSILSNLSNQLAQVGSEQLSGKIQCYKAQNMSSNGQTSANPAVCFLVMPDGNYDVIPLMVGGNSTVSVNGSSTVNIPTLNYDGKPTFVYIGAQGCPYCAQERYPIAIALSRFGNFTQLFYDRSATNDGNIPTFTFDYNSALFYNAMSKPSISGQAPYGDENPTPFFYGAYYNSNYINFVPLDEIGSSFLVNLTGIDSISPFVYNNVVLATDAFDSYHGFGLDNFIVEGVPFFDINNRYVFDGANLNPNIIFSNLTKFSTHESLFSSLQNPTPDSFGETALGAANILTAQICEVINNTAPVCSLGYIQGLEKMIKGM